MSNHKVAPIDIGEAKRDPEYLAHLRKGEALLQRIAEAKRDARLSQKTAKTNPPTTRKPYAETARGQQDLTFVQRLDGRVSKAMLECNYAESKLGNASRAAKERPNDPWASNALYNATIEREAATQELRSLIERGKAAKERLGLPVD